MTTHEIIIAMKDKASRDNRKLYDEAVKKLELLESLPDKLAAMGDDYGTFGDTQFMPGLYKAAKVVRGWINDL